MRFKITSWTLAFAVTATFLSVSTAQCGDPVKNTLIEALRRETSFQVDRLVRKLEGTRKTLETVSSPGNETLAGNLQVKEQQLLQQITDIESRQAEYEEQFAGLNTQED